MFRHKGEPEINDEEEKLSQAELNEKKVKKEAVESVPDAEKKKVLIKKEFTNQLLGELLEKNLKWSQIIYEQNRRINRKLIWISVMSWLKVGVVLVIVAISAWFLPPFISGVVGQYQSLLGDTIDSGLAAGKNANNEMLEKFFQLLPLNSVQQEQIKTILK